MEDFIEDNYVPPPPPQSDSPPPPSPPPQAAAAVSRAEQSAPLRVATYNVNGLGKRVHEVVALANQYDIDVVAITETKQSAKRSKLLMPTGWTFVNQPRANSRGGGGVGLLYRDDVKVQRMDAVRNASHKEAEWITFKLLHGQSKQYDALTVYYHPPDVKNAPSKALLESIRDEVRLHNCRGHLVVGDFNCCLWKTQSQVNKVDVIERHTRVSSVGNHISDTGKVNRTRGAWWYRHMRKVGIKSVSSVLNLRNRKVSATHYTRNTNTGKSCHSVLDYAMSFGRDLERRCGPVQVRETRTDHSLLFFDVEQPTTLTPFVPRPRFNRLGHVDPEKRKKHTTDYTIACKEAAADWRTKHPDSTPDFTVVTELMTAAAFKALGKTTPRRKRGINPKPWWSRDLTHKHRYVKKLTRRLFRARRKDSGQGAKRHADIKSELNREAGEFRRMCKAAQALWYTNILKAFNTSSASTREQFRMLKYMSGNFKKEVIAHTEREMYDGWKPVISQKPPVTSLLQRCDAKLATLIEEWDEHGPNLLDDDDIVTPAEVVEATEVLANYKAAGMDGITNMALKAMGGKDEPFVQLFADACNQLLRDPAARPTDWNRALVCMIPKEENPEVRQFRPITLLSCVKKLMQKIMGRRHDKHQRENGSYTSDAQGGFKNEREALETSLRLVLAAQRCKELNKPLFGIFYDTKKAFDCVPYSLMATAFHKRNLPSYMQRYLHYDNTGTAGGAAGNVRRLLVGTGIDLDDHSYDLPTARGAAQGGVLSPTGYNVANDPLTAERVHEDHESIDNNTSAIRFKPDPYREIVGEAAYADDYNQFDTDAVQLAERCALHTQPHIVQSGMVMNGSPKTVAVIMGGGNLAKATKAFEDAAPSLYDERILLVPGYKHLGTWQQRRHFQDANEGRGKLDIKARSAKLTNSTLLRNNARVYGANRGCPLKVGAMMARALVYASLFFGVELFPINFTRARKVVAKYAKGALGTYDCSSSTKALEFLGWPTMEMTQSIRTVTFALRCCTHPVRDMALSYVLLLQTGGSEVHSGGILRYRLPWVAHVNNGVRFLGIETEFKLKLSELKREMEHGDESQKKLRDDVTVFNDELKKSKKRKEHQCVTHSFEYAHHSFMFFHMKQFDPLGVEVKPCYVCGDAGGDTPQHLVACKHNTVRSIISHLSVAMRRVHVLFLNLESADVWTEHLLISASADDDPVLKEIHEECDMFAWKEIARTHGRLYRLRKALRDQSMDPSKKRGTYLLRSEALVDICTYYKAATTGLRYYHAE